jgi:plastocyanin
MRKLLLLLCLAAAGCGGEKSTPAATSTSTSTPAPAVVPVAMRNIKFVPARVTVRVGQTVRWTNHDTVAHTVASAKLKLASEAIAHGQTYGYKATKPGTFPYYCTIHANQNGVLVVTR